jgi:6-phosphogluconolactonase
MPDPTPPDIRVAPDYETLSARAADYVAQCAQDDLAERSAFRLVLAGGGTPEGCYERLAADHGDALDWARIHLFWGDERYVPADHADSNQRTARETLTQHVPIPDANVHPMPTEFESPEHAARAYASALRDAFGGLEADAWPVFDLVLLGLGSDGHTASLFPENVPALTHIDDSRWVRAVEAPPRHAVSDRLTLTLPVLNHARRVCFLVSGASKRGALHAILDRQDEALPATHVRPDDGTLVWFVDEDAYDAE